LYIIVVGGGSVGAGLSGQLVEMGHEVLVIERSQDRCDLIREDLGSVVLHGDGCEVATLTEAGADRADIFIAMTDGDEDNLVACQVAQHRFHIGRAIARVNEPSREKLFKQLGITSTVNAAETMVNGVLHEIPGRSLTHLVPFRHAEVNLTGIRIPSHAAAIGKAVLDIQLPEGTGLALVVRADGTPLVPSADIVLQPNDEVIALTRPEDEAALVQALTR
jgi:trk system potassium uptake protein TrkA